MQREVAAHQGWCVKHIKKGDSQTTKMMMSQAAFDRLGNKVYAWSTEKKRGARYTCDCPGKHRMKLVKPLGLGKRSFRDYFAHVSTHHSKDEKPKCARCCANGESVAHRNAKHALQALQGSFSFALRQCPDCREQVVETCARGVIDMEIASDDGRWRYDCLLRVDGRPVLALEVVHTHFSSEEKVAATRADGVALAEFRVEDVMRMQEAGGGWIENLQVMVVLCEKCVVRWQAECLAREVAAWGRWEEYLASQHQSTWEARAEATKRLIALAAKRKQEDADWMALCWKSDVHAWVTWDSFVSDSYQAVWNIAERTRRMQRALAAKRKQEDADWMVSCWRSEVHTIQTQNNERLSAMDPSPPDPSHKRPKLESATATSSYFFQRKPTARDQWMLECFEQERRAWLALDKAMAEHHELQWERGAVRRMLTGAELHDAKAIVNAHWVSISISHPRFGEIKLLEPPDDDENGLYIYEWACHATLPTSNLYIRLLPSAGILPETRWRMENDTEDSFIIFLHCTKVISDLSCIEKIAKGERWSFKDCRWAILKNQERTHGICANCGRRGHQSEGCYKKFCIRCGRKGHVQVDCFARRDVLSRYLPTT